ncbi:MAG: hypothetical protein ABF271_02560, partial [Abyssibacter sp.]|uniref:DUF7948 domain-containing protein n=1 Tax=Abyssibacter sp. TaxID=2320200 RepID=UPI00321AFD4C
MTPFRFFASCLVAVYVLPSPATESANNPGRAPICTLKSEFGTSHLRADGLIEHRQFAMHSSDRMSSTIFTEDAGIRPLDMTLAAQPLSELTPCNQWFGLHAGSTWLETRWPDISLQLETHPRGTERVYRIAPHAHPDAIQLTLAGGHVDHIASSQSAVVHTPAGALAYSAPIAFQFDQQGQRKTVPVRYRLDPTTHAVSFDLGPYDLDQTLYIDPILQSTYVGGPRNEGPIDDMALDPDTGELIVVGNYSSGLPEQAAGGFQDQPQVQGIGLAKIDPTLRTLGDMTMLGGAFGENAYAVAVHPENGDIYLAGTTSSPGFPGPGGGAHETMHPNRVDSFVTRMDRDLRSLTQTTYLGPTDPAPNTAAGLQSMAIHPVTGDVYVVGKQGGDAIVRRFDAALQTQLGEFRYGDANHFPSFDDILVHPLSGDLYVTGITQLKTVNGRASALHSAPNESQFGLGGYIVRLSPDLETLKAWTFVAPDFTNHYLIGNRARLPLQVDPSSGDLLVAATIGDSTSVTTVGAQSSHGGDLDILLVRFDPSLSVQKSSTFLGDRGEEYPVEIQLSPDGRIAYLFGMSSSGQLPGHQPGAISDNPPGRISGFVARLTADLESISATSFIGSEALQFVGAGLVLPGSGDVIVAGSSKAGVPETHGGWQPTVSGQRDWFLVRFDATLSAVLDDTVDPPVFPTLRGV